jgi:hypothetical protein
MLVPQQNRNEDRSKTNKYNTGGKPRMKKTAIAQKSASSRGSRQLVIALTIAMVCAQTLSASDIISKVKPNRRFATATEAKEAVRAGRVPAEFYENGEGYYVAMHGEIPTVFIIRMDGDAPYVMSVAPEACITESTPIYGKAQVAAAKTAATAMPTHTEPELSLSREEKLALLVASNVRRFKLASIGAGD